MTTPHQPAHIVQGCPSTMGDDYQLNTTTLMARNASAAACSPTVTPLLVPAIQAAFRQPLLCFPAGVGVVTSRGWL